MRVCKEEEKEEEEVMKASNNGRLNLVRRVRREVIGRLSREFHIFRSRERGMGQRKRKRNGSEMQ